ncbi:MAG: hypothetical protein HY702_03075 [Gemmatimonadetes bacterium]|nr:hypothetical protein [Gemmatimonadota bacterium]
MIRRRSLFRACAAALLLVLPAVAATPLVLHARERAQSLPVAEGHHQTGCVRLHDHGACTLLQRTPWAPPVPLAIMERAASPRCTRPFSDAPAHVGHPALQKVRLRSPPVSA